MKKPEKSEVRAAIAEHKQRLSLTLAFSLIVFFLLVITGVIVAAAVAIMIRNGTLRLGDMDTLKDIHLTRIVLICVALGTALSAITGRVPLKPVNKVINAMNRLASGNYHTRLSFNGPLAKHPTVREVTDSFNAMAEELEHTELLRADFVNNFSHEFKTPIVSIAGFAKLLRKGDLSEQEREEYLEIIENESLRLSAMATNVLNMTKVENQTILTDVRSFNLSEQLRSCVLQLENRWTGKDLEWEMEPMEYTVSGSEELLREVWLNLLDNAIKFSPKWGVIRVSITERDGITAVSVTNTGSEIAPEERERIFQKFYQSDRSHATEGNGIGLAVVKRVVELHRGAVLVDSGEDKTTFTVLLPNSDGGA